MFSLTRTLPFLRTLGHIRTFTTSPALKGDVAKVFLIGRTGRDPFERTLPSGKQFLEYVVGTSFGSGENRKTSWFTVQCFNEREQNYVRENVPKGTLVWVEGDLTISIVQGEDGKNRQYTNIYHRNLAVLKKPASALQSRGEGEGEQTVTVGETAGGEQVVGGDASHDIHEGQVV